MRNCISIGELGVAVQIEALDHGVKTVPIIFTFYERIQLLAKTILREKTLKCIRESDVELYDSLQPVTAYTPQQRQQDSNDSKLKIMESDFLPEFM